MGPPSRVVIGLGSNRRHGRHGAPAAVLAAAVGALAAGGVAIERVARVRHTAPLGPSSRRFANGAVLGRWGASPAALLALCQAIERDFGRRRGRRWGARVLDLDLWVMDGATLATPALTLPHPALHRRAFALDPLAELWPDWRHPRLRLSVRQMRARLAKRQRSPRCAGHGAGS